MINWKVRIKNKVFWVTFIPAVLILIRAIAAVAGVELDFASLGERLLAVVESVFTILGILGIVVDPTTEGIQDSRLAMTYTDPKPFDPPAGETKPPDAEKNSQNAQAVDFIENSFQRKE